MSVVRNELTCWVGAAIAVVFLLFGKGLMAGLGQVTWYGFLLVWLFATMLWLSFSVVRHAVGLAVLLGEPLGTLILTLSVTSIEVVLVFD